MEQALHTGVQAPMPSYIARMTGPANRTAALILALVLALANPLAPPVLAQGLPSLGDSTLSALQERRIGDAIIADVYRDPDYMQDPILEAYVDGIWQALRKGGRERGEISPDLDEAFSWQLLLGRDRDVNAFTLPGGYMGLLAGLVSRTRSRDELAAVMAHEMGHMTQRHIARMVDERDRKAPLMLATMVLGAIAASQNPQAGAAIATGGQALLIQDQLRFSRSMEREADRIGYGILMQSGFRPEGFAAMFEHLQAASRLNDNGDWPYLRSHPLTNERIADTTQRLQRLPKSDPPAPDLEAHMMAGRALALSQTDVDALRRWAAEPEQRGFSDQGLARQASTVYRAAMAQKTLRQAGKAQELAAQLEGLLAGQAPAVHGQALLLQAEMALNAGQAQAALRFLEAAQFPQGDGPGRSYSRAVLMLKSEAWLDGGQPEPVVSGLQTWLSDHPGDVGAWEMMVRAQHASGNTLRALRAEGEVHMARHDYAGAIDRFLAAQDWARSNAAQLIDASIVDARLQAARQQQTELEKLDL